MTSIKNYNIVVILAADSETKMQEMTLQGYKIIVIV